MADYHVATTGSNSNPGTQASPWLTIAYALEHGGGPSNRIWIHAGTYAEVLNSQLAPIVGGASWATRLIVSRWSDDVVVVAPAAGERVVMLADADASFIEFIGLELDGSNITIDVVKVTYGTTTGVSREIQFTECEIHSGPGQGVLVSTAHHVRFVGCSIHANGTVDTDHGLYISSHSNLVDRCDVYDNAGWGVHIYNGAAAVADSNIVRDSLCHDNAAAGNRGAGILLSSGFGNVAENNVCWGNQKGIQVDYLSQDAVLRDNVIYGNDVAQIEIGGGAINTEQDDNRLPVAA